MSTPWPIDDRIGAHRQRLGHVGAGANAAGDDELHLPAHVEILERLDRLAHRRERRDADVLDEHRLRRGGAALHAVDHDHVGAGMNRQLHVVERRASRRSSRRSASPNR